MSLSYFNKKIFFKFSDQKKIVVKKFTGDSNPSHQNIGIPKKAITNQLSLSGHINSEFVKTPFIRSKSRLACNHTFQSKAIYTLMWHHAVESKHWTLICYTLLLPNFYFSDNNTMQTADNVGGYLLVSVTSR